VSSKGVVKDMSAGNEMHETFEKEPKFYNVLDLAGKFETCNYI
jgi:hypothetical protein